jgi:predicted GH43/DUF377 family glycosyl hydrolase
MQTKLPTLTSDKTFVYPNEVMRFPLPYHEDIKGIEDISIEVIDQDEDVQYGSYKSKMQLRNFIDNNRFEDWIQLKHGDGQIYMQTAADVKIV